MPNNSKQGIVCCLADMEGKFLKVTASSDPVTAIEAVMPMIADGQRRDVRLSCAAAVERMEPKADGSYSRVLVRLEAGGSGYLVVMPGEVAS